jgi:transposase
MNVPEAVQKTFQEKRKAQKACLLLKQIHGNYYIYSATSKWNSQKHKPQKITFLQGAISPDGQYTPTHSTKTSQTAIYEYANSQLCQTLTKDVQDALKETPNQQELLALSITRAIDPVPLRLVQTRWNKLYASKNSKINLSPRHLSEVLTTLGNMPQIYDVYGKLAQEGGMLFYDLTAVLSYSKNLKLSEKGYNSDWAYENQINVIMAFSTTTMLPVAVDVFCGSIRDVKTIRQFIERFPNKDIGFILDRGFASYKLILDLLKEQIHYIQPLKKNATIVPKRFKMTGTIVYRKRAIAFFKKKTRYGFLYLYEDPSIGGEEENALLHKVNEGKLTLDDYRMKKRLAGVFGVLSDLDVSAQSIYEQYKEREEIELSFDVMKNELEADKTYLGKEDAVRGYFIMILLSMRLHFKILRRLREKNLVGKVSVREVLFELSKMEMIVENSGREYLCATPKRAEEIHDVFSDLIPMG